MKNGVETDKTLDLRKENNWTGNFTDLDEYENGVKVKYTIKEVGVPKGYTSVITGNTEKGFVVTNTMPLRNPNTGDNFDILMYSGLVLLSGVSLLTLMKKRRNL